MKRVSKQEVIDAFNAGKSVKSCTGLWNDPRVKGEVVTSVEEIERFYYLYYAEGKVYDNDNTVYIHGYTGCDMF